MSGAQVFRDAAANADRELNLAMACRLLGEAADRIASLETENERRTGERDELLRRLVATDLNPGEIARRWLAAPVADPVPSPENREADADEFLRYYDPVAWRDRHLVTVPRPAPSPEGGKADERCTGASDCPAPLHVHGCRADHSGAVCDDRADHDDDDDRVRPPASSPVDGPGRVTNADAPAYYSANDALAWADGWNCCLAAQEAPR